MKFKKLFAVAGAIYAGALAFAMKKRKDEGTSHLAEKATDSTFQNIVDEIVEIHKNAYNDTKNFVVDNFSDVKDFETLKNRVSDLTENFVKVASEKFEEIKNNSSEKTEDFKKFLEENYEKAKISLSNAEEKIKNLTENSKENLKNFSEDAKENTQKFLSDSKTKIEETYSKMKNNFSK